MRVLRACALTTLMLAAGGCVPGPLNESAWPEARPLGRDLTVVRPPPSAEADAALTGLEEPTGDLSLRDALAAALLGSPMLAATGYEVRAREAEVLQAGLLPNPELGVELENFAGSGELGGFDALETTLALSQLVELGGKRVRRRRVAEYEAQLAGWEFETQRLDVLTKTASDYVGLLAAERQLRIAIDTMTLSQRVFDAVRERVDAGKVSPVDRLKARVELAQAQLGLEQARRSVAAARVRLASNWGGTEPKFDALLGDLDQIEPPPEIDSLLRRVEQNPDLARWAAEQALRRAEVELALSQRVPDLTVTGGVRHHGAIDETALVAGLSMPLPLFDRNQGEIRAARLRALEEGRLEEAARVEVHAAVASAHQVLDTAFISVNTIRDQVLPSSERSFEAAEEAFRQGKIGALDLLDAERTLFDARRQLTDALATYHLAVVSCERLIGASLHGGEQEQGPNQ